MFAMDPENQPVTHSGCDSISIYTHKNDNCVCQKGKIANICVCIFIYFFNLFYLFIINRLRVQFTRFKKTQNKPH